MLYSENIHVCVCECACELRVLSRAGAGAGVGQWRAWGGGEIPAAEGGGGRSPVITGVVESSETAEGSWILRQRPYVAGAGGRRTLTALI